MRKFMVVLGIVFILLGILAMAGAFVVSPALEDAGASCDGGGCTGVAIATGVLGILLFGTGLTLFGAVWLLNRFSFVPGMISRLQSAVEHAEDIRTNGIRGVATVRAVRPTSLYINEQPVPELDVEIEAAGERYTVHKSKQVVHQVYLARLVPGARIPVMVDPANPNAFLIEWEGDWADEHPESHAAEVPRGPRDPRTRRR